MEKLIETENLYTNFYTFEGVVKALNGVSIVVNRGETYGLVGESGCGKSVTVRSMMRIVQTPGRIESGKVLLFFSKDQKKKAIDILKRSETYMETIRGNDISMIFQEAGTSLNPVLSIDYQVGESFFLHRKDEILEKTCLHLKKELERSVNFLKALWKKYQASLFLREFKALKSYGENVNKIDLLLYEIEDDTSKKAEREKKELNRKRGALKKNDTLCSFISHIPFLKLYSKILKKTVNSMAVSLLTDLGIPNPKNVLKCYPHELSGGMQQRIVIAIALACQPTLLIADEPTSNLDVTIQAQILDLIKKLKKTTIASVLFITHDLGVVAETCDRVTVMYAGDACETTSVKELFKNPLHPYSKGLLRSVPGIDQKGELKTIPGVVPNLITPPSGCRFHPRCPKAMDICVKEKPKTIEYSQGHTVACHLYLKQGSGQI